MKKLWSGLLSLLLTLALLTGALAEDLEAPEDWEAEAFSEAIEADYGDGEEEIDLLDAVATQAEEGQTEPDGERSPFVVEDGVLTRYEGSDARVVVPEGVREIGEGAFSNNAAVESVVLPEGLTAIRAIAFSGSGLRWIEIPASVERIGDWAFSYCPSLEWVFLRNAGTEIGEAAFEGSESAVVSYAGAEANAEAEPEASAAEEAPAPEEDPAVEAIPALEEAPVSEAEMSGAEGEPSPALRLAAAENTVYNLTAQATGDRMIRLDWAYQPPAGGDASTYQYLIYRANGENGAFTKIGYTSKNVLTYTDAGGEGSLTAGETYVYKVQAYDAAANLASELTGAMTASATAALGKAAENEFVLSTQRAQALAWVRERLAMRAETITLDLWMPSSQISGFSASFFDEAMSGRANTALCYSARTIVPVVDPRIQRDGLNRYTLAYTVSYDVVYDLTAAPEGDRMIQLSWAYSVPAGSDASAYQYLIYRADSEDGDYAKIGYTTKNVQTYTDAGGDAQLNEGTSYFYKVQAYNPKANVSTNLTNAMIVSAAPRAMQAPNEFVMDGDEDAAIEYLLGGMAQRQSRVSLDIWLPASQISGYANSFFNTAMSRRSNTGACCSARTIVPVVDQKLQRNGLNKYTLAYEFSYDVVRDVWAEPSGDRMVELNWAYDVPAGGDASAYRYLIYRAEAQDGPYQKIGYTPLGALTYVDAGGDAQLTAGKPYYYKVQAYNESANLATNLDWAMVAACEPEEQSIEKEENEFILDEERQGAADYLRGQVIDLIDSVSLILWVEESSLQGTYYALLNEAMADREDSGLFLNGFDCEVTSTGVTREGKTRYLFNYTFTYDSVTALTAWAEDDRMVRLSWYYAPPAGQSQEDYQYLVFRADEKGGEFTQIGYTYAERNANGGWDLGYTDAGGVASKGGAGELTAGKTYYYKVQAYNPTAAASTNLGYAMIASATPAAQQRPENEFMLEDEKDQAAAYLRQRMVDRETTARLLIWLDPAKISGYSAKLFEAAVEETEDASKINEGDYLWYHLAGGGYDCQLIAPRISRNGLNRYELIYTFEYYTTADQERQVLSTVDRVIRGFNFTDSTTDAEKVKAVYEWLSEDASYDLSLNQYGLPRCSAYDAIVNKRAVCQGYSNATYLFLRRLGIMNRIIDGSVIYDGEDRAHAWNLVEIDGKWYNTCVTTEVHMREGYDTLSYRYLLKADNDAYFDIFRRGKVEARGIDYSSGEFRGGHSAIESYDLTDIVPALPEGVTAITDLKAVATGDGGVRLTWSYEPPEAGTLVNYQYLIKRADKTEGPFDQIGYTKPNEFAYVDRDGLQAGKKYYYKVQAYWNADTAIFASNLYYANVASMTMAVASQTMGALTVAPKSGVTMTLSWDAYVGAKRYDIWHAEDGGAFSPLKSTGASQTSTSHTGLTAGTRHWYRVYAVDTEGVAVAVTEDKAAVTLATPTLYAPTADKGGVTLSWSKASGADRYNVYRSESENGSYAYIQSVQRVERYTDATAVAGKTYFYKVRPYKKLDGIVYYGGYSDAAGVLVADKLAGLTVAPKSGVTMTLAWSALEGAYGYEIWHKADGGQYARVKATGANQTSASHTGLTAGTRHWYRVLAVDRDGGVLGQSDEKAAVALATPALNAPEVVGGGVALTWSKASGADRYNIYRADTENGNYAYLQSVQKVERYTDGTAEAGRTYYYKVRAYKKLDGIVYYGGYSEARSVKTPAALGGLTAVPKSGVTMTLAWGGASGAYAYEIWHAADGAAYSQVKTTGASQTSASDTGLTAGTRYWYRVLARDKGGKALAWSNAVAAVALATPALNAPTFVNGVELTWSKASGADRYNIYRSDSAGGKYTYLESVQKVEHYTDYTAEWGKTYYYKVRAYKKLDGIVYYGGYSDYKSITVK